MYSRRKVLAQYLVLYEGEISGFCGKEYEDGCFLECCVLYLVDIDWLFRGDYRLHHQGDIDRGSKLL
jgi:hypothetical protein